ncbi:HAMP domain-containing sensor histidine kinase [Phenylobacterium sp. LjRoot219]|uniref:sensor histidine kinase n=1 Tax=Phenylobacterium sp. LjRoot219 TaxID=3342283 RepID=UPI003ECC48C3
MADAPTTEKLPKPSPRRYFWPGGLSARLLVLTVLFVALGGALTLPPSLASYEQQWLLDRVRAAELASLAPEVAPDRVVSEQLKAQFLNGAGVDIVAVSVDGARSLVFAQPRPGATEAPYLVDLRDRGPGLGWLAPFRTLFGPDGRRVRVVAEPRIRKADFVEFVASDAELKRALANYLRRQILITAFVSTITGVLVYLALNLFLVRPMQRITRAMERFRTEPEDPEARIELSGRRDEIGRAEVELSRMQADLRAALHSRARLAALGEAVAKINHDLRNMLTSAQIASERLAALKDPKVSQALPRLERALDRAVRLASDVLAYGKTQEPAPESRVLPLRPAVDVAAEEARLSDEAVRLVNDVADGDQVSADPDQLHRILVNLMRNAREAIEHQDGRTAPGVIRVSLAQADGVSQVRVADNGPGVPDRARERLFQAFAGSGRPEGAGLGLAIARELAQAHGGDLALAETSPSGSVFELRLPGAPPRAPLKAPRARSSA